MGPIEELHADLESEVTLEQFRERVADKIDEMGGLADEETAAMLVAHELDGSRPIPIGEVTPELEHVTVLGVVRHIGSIRTFERDDGAQGSVLNVELADESGNVRAAFWDEMATAVENELDIGDTLRLRARPREGYDGLELSVTDVRTENDLDVGIEEPEASAILDLKPGMEGVIVEGEVLRVGSVRSFQRDDGSEGRVATVVLGDETDAISTTLWGEATEAVSTLTVGECARIEGGSVRERDGRVEVHIGGRARITPTDSDVRYDPTGDAIADLKEGDAATITGIVRSTDPIRTFDRSDGTEGQVRNVRVQDRTGDIRVALWGNRAEIDLAPGDEVTVIDVQIQEGYRDDLEASANWRSTVVQRSGSIAVETESTQPDEDHVEEVPTETTFTGTVVQPGDPIILDDGSETVHVSYHGDVQLGERVTVTGTRDGDQIDADSLRPADSPR